MANIKTRKIGKYGLIGKPKSIKERLALSMKMKRNMVKRVKQKNESLIDSINKVNQELQGSLAFNKKRFITHKANERKQDAKKLRNPGLPQKMKRAELRKTR